MFSRLLNGVIRFSLDQRVLVAVLAVFLMVCGGWQIAELPIDVFPSLDRPRVVVMTEAPGLAPEEVETLITFPLETALNGATGVEAVRTSSGVGLSVVYVEFDWGTDIFNDRQIVFERLALVSDRMPPGVTPQLAPISSIMGQIMIIGMWSEGGKTSPMQLRTLADWVVRQRLLTIRGVSQTFVMGGDRKQFQALVDPDALLRYGVTLKEVKTALAESNENATGGYLDDQGPNELLVRSLGRIRTVEQLKDVVVTIRDGRPVLVGQVARVIEGPEVKRGDSGAFVREEDGHFTGGPAVVLTINKQPNADTRQVTEEIARALEDLKERLPGDVRMAPDLYQQKLLIDMAIENVVGALRDGSILVVIVLFLFLVNFRTTFITLTAIPLSIIITALVFGAFGLSINTMTLGGLAVAIGEMVDNGIVGVENTFRRLRENRHSHNPKPALLVVFQANAEVLNPVVFGTIIIALTVMPVFALHGMEGRLFAPIAVAYIVSLLSSLLVAVTLTPVLSYWLLPSSRIIGREKEGLLLRGFKTLAGWAIGLSLRAPVAILLTALVAACVGGFVLLQLESDFLPPFNEGAVQVNVVLKPGTSLATSQEVAREVAKDLQQIDDIVTLVRKTGRAELDEHAVPVSASEFIATLDPNSQRSREEILAEIRATLDKPWLTTSVEQPLAHLISHMLSGVQAQVAIKLYGDDLEIMRRKAQEMGAAIADVPGVTDLQVEPQREIPQLRIEILGHELKNYGLRRAEINELVETAMNGRVVSEVLIGQRTFDLLVRLDEPSREDIEAVKRLSIDLPGGGTTSLESVARIYEASGPNTISREQVRRRIVIQCNTSGRGLVDVVEDIKARLKPIERTLQTGYFVEYGGQFESQQSASRVIAVFFAVTLVGVFLVLYTMFRSANLSLQVMIAVPTAFIGGVAALVVTGQTLTVAALVGFLSIGGSASRNGILLLNHYLHLVRHEGETFSPQMILRAGKERLAPVLMTALTSGIGLVPLVLAAGEPGKELLYPIATVTIGGLITSTILEFFVRPALFWKFGLGAARRVTQREQDRVALEEEPLETPRPAASIDT